ncbi:MAG: effector-associated domain EAD1-containing protein [Trichodesmium sp. MAG_R03]|nr:effector-associated domain EAD1-containing protein [Trichodesmium sp. MAG_R03]
MKLSTSEINVLFKALQDGYRNYDELKIMVRLKLGKNLTNIVQPDKKIDIVILELIEWAESKDKLLDLVWGANERNPDNDQIKKVSYRLFGITQAQWEKLCELLAEINPTDLEFACKESFKPKNIVEVDSRLVDLKYLDREEIQDILKENLIKKREESLRKVPVVFEFADCLSGMFNVGMNTICSDVKRWTEEVNNQLSKLGKKNGSYRKMNTNLQDFGQRAILDSDVTPIRNFGPHLQEVKNQEFPSNNEQKEYLRSRRRLGMGLTDNQKQYFYEEIQRVFPNEEDLKIIFIDNEGKFGKNFYNDIDGKNYRNKLTFLTIKLQNKDFLYSFIEVVQNEYPNFAQEL